MRLSLFLAFLTSLSATPVRLAAQDLAPRAYVITPVHSNAINVTTAYFSGGADFNGAAPITNATGRYNIEIINLYHSLSLFGRSANIAVGLPYGIGNFQGDVSGQTRSVYRSGLLDCTFRFSINLLGGPAMEPKTMIT
jgi:hypothetical protein